MNRAVGQVRPLCMLGSKVAWGARTTARRCLRVLMLAMVALLGSAWAAQSNADGPAVGSLLAKGSAGDLSLPNGSQSAQGSCIEKAWAECAKVGSCSVSGGASALFTLPGCIAKDLLDPCNGCAGNAISLVTLVVCFAVLTRQAAMAYRQNWRLSFALFLILFLGTTISVVFFSVPEPLEGASGVLATLVAITFAGVFLAGVLAYWTKYLLDLLAVMAAASLVAPFAPDVESPYERTALIVMMGVAGGLWLYWWRDHRRNRKAAATSGRRVAGGQGS